MAARCNYFGQRAVKWGTGNLGYLLGRLRQSLNIPFTELALAGVALLRMRREK